MDFIDHRSTAQFTFLTSATDEKIRINADGDLLVGISTPFDTSGITLDATGALGVDGHITVATGATYDIGTATNKFRDLYLSGDINVAGVSTSGDLTVGGSLSVTTDATVTGSLTVSTDATITNDLTVSNDATVSGDLTVSTNAVIAGDLTVNGTTTTINTETLDVKDKNITLNYGGDTTSADGAGITIEDAVGAGTDATILWDGSSDTFDFSHAIDVTGTITADNNLTIQNSAAYGSIELGGVSGGFIDIKRPFSDDYDLRLIAEGDGGVINVASGELTIQRAGSAKLATTSTGIAVTGNATFGDNGKAIFGAGSDLQIYHDGSNSYIAEGGTGNLQIQGQNLSLEDSTGTRFFLGIQGGETRLYNQGNEKVAVTSTGIDVTGTITFDGGTTSANLNFGDNDKAVFGGGSDLQIYHDGTHSYVSDQGTGSLFLRSGSNIYVQNSGGTANYFKGTDGGAAELFYNGSARLATTSTGIDVTGTVTADGLTVDGTGDLGTIGNGAFNAAAALGFQSDRAFFGYSSSQNALIQSGASKGVVVEVNSDTLDGGTRAALFASNGDISFYEDTGVNQKFYWDASTEFLGLGSTAPSAKLDIVDTSADVQMRVYKNDGTKNTRVTVTADDSGAKIHYRDADNAGALRFNNNLGEVMRITADTTRVGIGTTNPTKTLTVFGTGAGNATVQIEGEGGADPYINFLANNTQHWSLGIDDSDADKFKLSEHSALGTNDYLVVDVSGNVGIGTSSPSSSLTTEADSGVLVTDASGLRQIEIVPPQTSNGFVGEMGTRSSHPLVFNTVNTERMRIDSAGRLGLGTSSPAYPLHVWSDTTIARFGGTDTNDTYLNIFKDNASSIIKVQASKAGAGATNVAINPDGGRLAIGTSSPDGTLHVKGAVAQVYIQSNDGQPAQIVFGDVSDASRGRINYDSSDNIIFENNNLAERMRIDASGNLLVGQTSATPHTNYTTAGSAYMSNGQIRTAAYDMSAIELNRTHSDGDIAVFRKQGTTVGSIGSRAGTVLYITSTGTNETGLDFGGTSINPMLSGSLSNGTTDLGNAGNRFKDLHLSGTANVGTSLGIGTSSIIGKLHANDSGGATVTLTRTSGATSGNLGKLRFGNTDIDSDLASIVAIQDGATNNSALTFGTQTAGAAVAERMRIDSSGNLLVGTTTTTAGNEGMVYFNGSSLRVTRDSDEPLNLDRLTTNGSLVDFKKDGTTVGSIGSYLGAYAYIGSTGGTDTHIGFVNGAVRPATATGAVLDATLDLGNSSSRFKDLYLSGTAYTNALGVGTTSPDVKVDIVDTAADVQLRVYKFDGTNNTRLALTADDSGAKIHYRDATNGGALRFNNNAGEMARFDASGNLLVGTTDSTPYNNNAGSTADNGIALSEAGWLAASRYQGTVAFLNRTDNDGDIAVFRKDGSTVGSISVAGSTTSYNTSSDQRLKENIADADDAVRSKVDAIQVRKFDWKVDGSHQDYGMVAQELNTVAPEAVSAPEDPEEMMGVDYSKLVPMLVKEIQSLRARVAQLETN